MKRKIAVQDHAQQILTALKSGVLLTTQCRGQVNTMSISWGTLGIQWGKPIFIAYVRGCRHTGPILDETGEFTVNIPLQGPADPEIIAFCGSRSGRSVDKLQALGLHTEPAQTIGVPGIRELPLTLECRVIYRQQQLPEAFCQEAVRSIYPAESTNIKEDFHTAYYGQILDAYIIE